MPHNRNIKPLADLINEILNLDRVTLSDADREILSALRVIANRYDDVYGPQIDDIKDDVEQILDKFDQNLELVRSLTKKVKGLPTGEQCAVTREESEKRINKRIDEKLEKINLPRLFGNFIKAGKWNLFVAMVVLLILAPYLQFLIVTMFAFLVEKVFGVNLLEIWPFLRIITGQ